MGVELAKDDDPGDRRLQARGPVPALLELQEALHPAEVVADAVVQLLQHQLALAPQPGVVHKGVAQPLGQQPDRAADEDERQQRQPLARVRPLEAAVRLHEVQGQQGTLASSDKDGAVVEYERGEKDG
jgi:hypothetical protein